MVVLQSGEYYMDIATLDELLLIENPTVIIY